MAPKRKSKTKTVESKPAIPPVKTVEKVVRMEVTVESPENIPRPEWQGIESAIRSKVMEVATHRPHDKAITIADSFETVGLTVKSVGPIEVGNESPEYSEARRLPERWYRDEVDAVVKSSIEELLTIAPEDREEHVHDMLHEAIDSRHCIIATAEARMVLAVSSNYDAYTDMFGEGDTSTWEQRAYCAMEADVREELQRRQNEWHPDHMPETDDDE